MRASIFTPGDMICRKGEVAREMFIIADGILEVIRFFFLSFPSFFLFLWIDFSTALFMSVHVRFILMKFSV